MAGNNSNRGGHGGRGSGGNGHGNTGHGRSYNANKSKMQKVGLCKELEGNIFDYGSKSSADQMLMTQEKIVQYAATKYGGDIANELQNCTNVVLNPPKYSADILARHTARETMVWSKQTNLLAAYRSKLAMLQRSASADLNADVAMDIAKVNNDIIELEFEITQDVETFLRENLYGPCQQTRHTLWASFWVDHGPVHTIASG